MNKVESKDNQISDFISEINAQAGTMKKRINDYYLLLHKESAGNYSEIYRRSFILLLYAYWEGFIKSAAKIYLTAIMHGADFAQLPHCLKVMQRRTEAQLFYKNVGTQIDNKTYGFYRDRKKNKDVIVDHKTLLSGMFDLVDTNSNLSARTYKRILEWLDLKLPKIELRRNLSDPCIAHPEAFAGTISIIPSPLDKDDATETTFTLEWYSQIDVSIDGFLYFRNGLAHDALSKAPDLETCIYFYEFVRELLSDFTDQLIEHYDAIVHQFNEDVC